MPLAMSSGTPSRPIGCRGHRLLTYRIDIVAAEIARPADKGLLAHIGLEIELTAPIALAANSSAADLVNNVTPPLVIE